MTRYNAAAVLAALAVTGYALDGTHGVIKVAYIVGGVAGLVLVVHVIDRVDVWGGRTHPSLRIVPEQTVAADVISLDSRRSA